jgi:MtN3 and saliva related transmembrane protein
MIDTIGYTAGLLAMITFLPQVIKTLRTKRAGDISMFMLLLTLATNILYIAYGALLKLYPIVIMIGIMSCTVLLQVVLTLKYRNHGQMANQPDSGDGK